MKGENEVAETYGTVDGTWQKRGFVSSLGVLTAIAVDSGKVLDCAIMYISCKGCTYMDIVKNIHHERYERWKASHKCDLNYRGSAPNMEKVGAVTIFERSVEKHGLYYTKFYGDDDSKSFTAV